MIFSSTLPEMERPLLLIYSPAAGIPSTANWFNPADADEIFSLKAGYFSLNPSGDVAVSTGNETGTVLDLDNDLGIGSDEGFMAEAALQLGSFRLLAACMPASFKGDNVLTQDIEFNDETFVAGSHVESDVKIDICEAGLAWFLVDFDDLPLRIHFGPEAAVKYVNARIEMQESSFSLSESESIGVPVPSLGARARVACDDYLGVLGRIGYLEYHGNSFMDLDAQVEFSPLPMIGIFAGYRYMDIDVDEHDVLIDATLEGPYVGALVRF
jgi:hypothetical protein